VAPHNFQAQAAQIAAALKKLACHTSTSVMMPATQIIFSQCLRKFHTKNLGVSLGCG